MSPGFEMECFALYLNNPNTILYLSTEGVLMLSTANNKMCIKVCDLNKKGNFEESL
jgi:hypothetical protein